MRRRERARERERENAGIERERKKKENRMTTKKGGGFVKALGGVLLRDKEK